MQKRILTSAFVFFTALTLFAWGKTADYTDEGMTPFIPFSEAIVCAVLAFVLFKLSGFLMDIFKDDKGDFNGCVTWIGLIFMFAAIILAFLSWYIFLAIAFITILFQKKK